MDSPHTKQPRRKWIGSFAAIVPLSVVVLMAVLLAGGSRAGFSPVVAEKMAITTPLALLLVEPTRPHREMRIRKTLVDPPDGEVAIGDNVTFKITIQNVGVVPIIYLWALDQYPPDCLTYVSSTPTGFDDGNGHVAWADLTISLGDLPPGGSVSCYVTFRAIAVCPNMVNYALASGWTSLNQPVPSVHDQIPIRVVPPNLCCKCVWPDYAPAGVPDFDQRQSAWQNLRTGAWSYSGPAALANSLWWYDSAFEPGSAPPSHIEDHYPLVEAYDQRWDDHSRWNVPSLIRDLAYRLDTDGQRTGATHDGTDIWDMYEAVNRYIADKGLAAGYAITIANSPRIEWINEAAWRGDEVLLLLGFWENQPGGWKRLGGHYVTVSCVSCPGDTARIIEFSDPYWDRAEQGGPGKYHPALPHRHPSTPPDTVHNDAEYLSRDLYSAVSVSTPVGIWGPQGYITSSATIANFLGQNFTAELERYRATEYLSGTLVTAVEYALAIRSLVQPPTCPGPTIPPTPTPTATPIPEEKLTTAFFQQGLNGYKGVKDTYINAWFPTQNYGRASFLQVRSGDLMSPLLRFDLSSIPQEAQVIEAKLTLHIVSGGWYDEEIGVFEVYRPWADEQTTWRDASRSAPWAEAGCNGVGADRSGDASDTALATTPVICEFDVKNMVRRWVADPAANHGVILKGAAERAVQHNVASSEYWHTARRPKLTVKYWTGP